VAIATTETSHGSEETDDDILGLVLTGISLGDITIGVGLQTQEDDSSFLVDIGIGNAYVHIESLDDDSAGEEPLLAVLGYTQSLGRKTTAWYELVSNDADTGDSDDDTTILRAVLKYDIE
jgi:hypothetical protein